MFNLFRLNRKIPEFDRLKGYQFQNYYFRRIAPWAWQDKFTIFVIDPNAPRFITMDPWPQKIFIAANGQLTISDYVYAVAREYRGKVPELLDGTIINEIETLLKERLIEIHESRMSPEVDNDKGKIL